jgi:NAD+ synthase
MIAGGCMLYSEILALSRQTASGGLTPWFDRRLKEQIDQGLFATEAQLIEVQQKIIDQLAAYRQQGAVGTAVLGMSGGVDSALTAALYKAAGWQVVGFTLPIHQNPIETERGVEACEALGIEHLHLDLSPEYEAMVSALERVDAALGTDDSTAAGTRRGNLRAPI